MNNRYCIDLTTKKKYFYRIVTCKMDDELESMSLNFFTSSLTLRQNKLERFLNREVFQDTSFGSKARSLPKWSILQCRTKWVGSRPSKNMPDTNALSYFAAASMKKKAGNTYWRERLSTVDLFIKVAHFVTQLNNIFNKKRIWSKTSCIIKW
jgi:hypothetical protein